MKFFKSIPTSFKILFLIFIVAIIILSLLPKDECGNLCGWIDPGYDPLVLMSISFLISLAVVIIETKRKKVSLSCFCLAIFIFLHLSFVVVPITRFCDPRWWGIVSDVKQIAVAQEAFHKRHGRYADSWDEIIESGELRQRVKYWKTEKELADADGYGFEGGDNDPQTWSVVAPEFIPDIKIDKWCRLVRKGYWLSCDQDGCHEKNNPPNSL